MAARYEISGDRCLILSPNQTVRMWGEFGKKERGFAGLQLGGLIWIALLLELAKRSGDRVAGLHGRIGPILDDRHLFKRPKVWIANSLVLPTRKLIKVAEKNSLNHILVHPQEAMLSFKDLLKCQCQVRIEQELSPQLGVGISLALVRELRAHGVNAALNVDTYHLAVEKALPEDATCVMRCGTQILREVTGLRDAKGEIIPITTHEPIGKPWYDSGDILAADADSVRERGKYYQQNPQVQITFEAQWSDRQIILYGSGERDTKR